MELFALSTVLPSSDVRQALLPLWKRYQLSGCLCRWNARRRQRTRRAVQGDHTGPIRAASRLGQVDSSQLSWTFKQLHQTHWELSIKLVFLQVLVREQTKWAVHRRGDPGDLQHNAERHHPRNHWDLGQMAAAERELGSLRRSTYRLKCWLLLTASRSSSSTKATRVRSLSRSTLPVSSIGQPLQDSSRRPFLSFKHRILRSNRISWTGVVSWKPWKSLRQCIYIFILHFIHQFFPEDTPV